MWSLDRCLLLFIWVFIISHRQPESFEVESGALSRCGIVMTLGLRVFVCLRVRQLAFVYSLIRRWAFLFFILHLYVKSSRHVALKKKKRLSIIWLACALAAILRAIIREELFFFKKGQDMFAFFFSRRECSNNSLRFTGSGDGQMQWY